MEELETKYRLIKSIVEYIDTSDNLNTIKQTCEKYKRQRDLLVYSFKLIINPVEITEIDASLGNDLLKSPSTVSLLFQEVIHQIIIELQLLSDDITLSQISVILRLSSLPVGLSTLEVKSCKNLSHLCDNSTGFVRLTGIVIGVTATSKYTQSTRYICQDTQCEGNHGNHFIRVHTPGASESQTIRNDFKCVFCWKTLVEVKTCRTLADRVVADFIPDTVFSTSLSSRGGQICFREQAVPVYIRDDLVKKIEIGQLYEVIGIIRKDYHGDAVIITIEANNIKTISTSCLPCLSQLPKSILLLYEDRKCSPWSFPLSLAYMFGADICPPGAYLKLKLMILLSLASLNIDQAEGHSPLHILAIGQDTEILHKLLMYGQTYTQRSCNHTTGKHLSGKVTTDKYDRAPYFVEGGSLLLARNGICYFGDLGKYKKTTCDTLQTILGNNKILIGIGSKYTGGLPQQLDIELQCNIWSYTNPTTQNKKPVTVDDVFTGCKTGDISKTLLDGFSMVQFVDCDDSTTNEEIALQCAYQHLTTAVQGHHGHNQNTVTEEDFKQFITYCQSVTVRVTDEADRIIQGYYIASRKARSTGTSSPVPVNSLHTLYSLARGHARLNINTEVRETDALMAVKLYEETITARFGYSVLSVKPTQHLSVNEVEQTLGPQNDKCMQQFHVQLLRFCTSQSTSEE